jgi:hypothetical protein
MRGGQAGFQGETRDGRGFSPRLFRFKKWCIAAFAVFLLTRDG